MGGGGGDLRATSVAPSPSPGAGAQGASLFRRGIGDPGEVHTSHRLQRRRVEWGAGQWDAPGADPLTQSGGRGDTSAGGGGWRSPIP